jgi:hypothetical protein
VFVFLEESELRGGGGVLTNVFVVGFGKKTNPVHWTDMLSLYDLNDHDISILVDMLLELLPEASHSGIKHQHLLGNVFSWLHFIHFLDRTVIIQTFQAFIIPFPRISLELINIDCP